MAKNDGIETFDGTTNTKAGAVHLALAESSRDILYANISEKGTRQRLGVYKTTTAAEPPGGTKKAWTHVKGEFLLQADGQAWYNQLIEVDPKDPKVLWVGGVWMNRSIDGGDTFTEATKGPDNDVRLGIHEDQHALVFDPMNSKIVYVGNDGGVYKSSDTSKPTLKNAVWRWHEASHGMIITQFYHHGVQQLNANLVAGGSQDNGTEMGGDLSRHGNHGIFARSDEQGGDQQGTYGLLKLIATLEAPRCRCKHVRPSLRTPLRGLAACWTA